MTPQKIDFNAKERRPRWLGRWSTSKTSCSFRNSSVKDRPGKPRKNWIDAIQQDLKGTSLTWKEVRQSSVNREDCRPKVSLTPAELRTEKNALTIHHTLAICCLYSALAACL